GPRRLRRPGRHRSPRAAQPRGSRDPLPVRPGRERSRGRGGASHGRRRIERPGNWAGPLQRSPSQGKEGTMKKLAALAFAASIVSLPEAKAAPVVFEAGGASAADIQSAVDDFRAFLGPLNPNVAGSFPSGRREINWDGVPDAFSAPINLPPNFFNANSPRGAVFFTPGTGFQVSADNDNLTHTPILFGNLNPVFPVFFTTFSPQRLFTALGSNVTETLFFVPGSPTGATVSGFGSVFTGVNSGTSTKIEYFDAGGRLLFSRNVLRGSTTLKNLSFLGV